MRRRQFFDVDEFKVSRRGVIATPLVEANAIAEILEKHGDRRTTSENDLLDDFCAKCPFFLRKDYTTEERRVIALDAAGVRLSRGERLFDQGDEANDLYIVVRGAVSVLVRTGKRQRGCVDDIVKVASRNTTQQIFSTTTRGIGHEQEEKDDNSRKGEVAIAAISATQSFGELALDAVHGRRSASIVGAVDSTLLMRIRQQHYRAWRAGIQKRRQQIAMHTLRVALPTLSMGNLMNLSQKCTLSTATMPRIIFREGQCIENVAFVVQGNFSVVKRCDAPPRGGCASARRLAHLGELCAHSNDSFNTAPLLHILEKKCHREPDRVAHASWFAGATSRANLVSGSIGAKHVLVLAPIEQFTAIVLNNTEARQYLLELYRKNNLHCRDTQEELLVALDQEDHRRREKRAILEELSPRYHQRVSAQRALLEKARREDYAPPPQRSRKKTE